MEKPNTSPTWKIAFGLSLLGPSDTIRTCDLHIPNVARYQLRYTRIFSFWYYTTPQAKIKDFPVCGQSCGQSRISAQFDDLIKSRKRPCFKAFRASAVCVVDGARATPKCGAVPAPLHPDIQFLLLYHAGGENESFSCLWSILWSKPFFGLFSQPAKIPQTPVPQGFPGFRFSGHGWCPPHSQSRRAAPGCLYLPQQPYQYSIF